MGDANSSPQPGWPIGWVDTHIHLLPGLDDGPADMEAALAMAETAIADGTTHIIATSHANHQWGYQPERVAELREQMQASLGDRLRLASGCELHLSFENVQAALANPRLYSLNGSRYLLCEFPEFFERASMGKALEDFRRLGVSPVLAHPERNPVFQQHPNTLLDYLRLGCYAQVTASSFGGRFGKRAEQFSAELLQHGWAHIVASDGHSAERRAPRLSRAYDFIEKEAGTETAQALCSSNPMAILLDQELPYAPSLAESKRKGLWSRLRS